MPSRKLIQEADLPSLLRIARALIDSLRIEIGKTFLVLEYSSLEDLAVLASQVALPHFFMCGKVRNFDLLRKILDSTAPLDFFLTSAGAEKRRILAFKDLGTERRGYLDIEGSPTALRLAAADRRIAIGGQEENFKILFESRDEVRQYLEVAMDDFRKDFEHRPFWAEFYSNFEQISEFAMVDAIQPSAELKGYLGFKPPGVPRTNVYVDRLPDLASTLDRMTTGRIELVQQITGLAGNKFESWNVLNLRKDLRKDEAAVLELYSLTAIPAALRKALEQVPFEVPGDLAEPSPASSKLP